MARLIGGLPPQASTEERILEHPPGHLAQRAFVVGTL
jgi:hypothetical protein